MFKNNIEVDVKLKVLKLNYADATDRVHWDNQIVLLIALLRKKGVVINRSFVQMMESWSMTLNWFVLKN